MLIIFQNQDLSICILSPAPGMLETHSLESLGMKDVPEGLPFWIVDESEIPADRTFREAWEVPQDWGPPDGYGSQFNTFEEIEDAQDKQ